MTAEDNIIRVDAEDLIGLRTRAERLRPARAMPAKSALAGAHRSRFRGRGMDYRESRHYQSGDDIRNMDWRITARSGHPHVKVFDEERERPVVVLGDFGPSMFFASRGAFKSVIAARLAALIGWSAISHGDRIGALLFNGGHQELQPGGGRRGQMRLIQGLVKAGDPRGMLRLVQDAGTEPDPAAGANLSDALARLRRVARPGSLVFILSDFYSVDERSQQHLIRLARHNDITAFQILDPLELAPPPSARYGVSDGRRSGILDLTNRQQQQRYAHYFSEHHNRVRALTEGNGIPLIQVSTDDDPAERLATALASRGRGTAAPSSGRTVA